MGEYLPGLLWLVFLLLGNGFFVAAEFAVISARRSQIEPKAEEGGRAARTALFAMEHATLMLATSQLGITICSLLILNVSEPAIHHLLEIPFGLTDLSTETVAAVSFVVALVLVTFLHVVFGEMVPKNLSFSLPDRAVLLLAPPLVFISRVFRPVIFTLNATANAVLRLVRVEPKDEANSTFTLDEVAGIVEHSTREGVLSDTTGALSNAFEFTAKKVHDVQVPLAELVMLPRTATPSEIQRAVTDHGFSRYILTDSDGDPVGYVHIKDMMDLSSGASADQPLPAKRIRSLISVLPDADIEDALTAMRRRGTHVARAVSRDGRVGGVVFLEDIIEELVGEVDDATSGG
jgi:magnesium and cobalt exporter, CNNM family